ncbi:hypothetical protein J4N45_26275 [Vibrio sp. SCSIO 43140]|uniref:hypothetical protein n=1 Tax=Vibrio sp. SCSIO 43140 TaxID=2819100 RepID=UPI0020756FA5|nr:hypothetical protein [Vibrio sp. SCSIO 43140]USD62864.1 hypothetical protein J4N45_26275 [Vibrio sp. SCSIO 43140]
MTLQFHKIINIPEKGFFVLDEHHRVRGPFITIEIAYEFGRSIELLKGSALAALTSEGKETGHSFFSGQ